MRVRMLTTAAGPEGVYTAGELWEMPNELARTMLAARVAVLADGSLPAVELAVTAPPENAENRPRRGPRNGGNHGSVATAS